MKALIIKDSALERILRGEKVWELRSTNSRIRGRIALIRSGSGFVIGTCDLVNVKGPLSLPQLRRNSRKIGLSSGEFSSALPYQSTYAWILADPKRFRKPIPYVHPRGAQIWVRLSDEILPASLRSK